MWTKRPTSPIASVPSKKGAPTIAPIATWWDPLEAPSRATIAISVSGIAVPTAASRLPTAPSPSSSPWPIHSTAFVKSSAPARMTVKLSASSGDAHRLELRRAT